MNDSHQTGQAILDEKGGVFAPTLLQMVGKSVPLEHHNGHVMAYYGYKSPAQNTRLYQREIVARSVIAMQTVLQ